MKKIWPTNNSIDSISATNSKPITQEDYENLVELVNSYEKDIAKLQNDQAAFIDSQEEAITTKNVVAESLSALQSTINKLLSDEIEVKKLYWDDAVLDLLNNTISFENIDVVHNTNNIQIKMDNKTIIEITPDLLKIAVPIIDVEDVQSKKITTDKIHVVDTITARNANFSGEVTFEQSPTFESFTAKDTTTTNLSAENADIEELDAKEITSEKIEAEDILANAFVSRNYTNIAHNYHKHEPIQVLEKLQETYYIVTPNFKNGVYYLVSEKADKSIEYSLELFNSIDNPMIRWSESEINNITNIYMQHWDDGSVRFIIECSAPLTRRNIYCACDVFTFEGQEPFDASHYSPTIYQDGIPYDIGEDTLTFRLSKKHGTYIGKYLHTPMLHADTVEWDEPRMEDLYLNHQMFFPIVYGEAEYTSGDVGMYITNIWDEDLEDYRLAWVEPIHNTNPTFLEDSKTLVTEAAVSNYTGESFTHSDVYTPITKNVEDVTTDEYIQQGPSYVKIDAIEYDAENDEYTIIAGEYTETFPAKTEVHVFQYSKSDDNHFNIVHLGDGTITHGNHEIENDLTVDNDVVIENNLTAKNGNVFFKHYYEGTDVPNMLDDSIVIAEGTKTTTNSYLSINGYVNNITPVGEWKDDEPISGIFIKAFVDGDFKWYKCEGDRLSSSESYFEILSYSYPNIEYSDVAISDGTDEHFSTLHSSSERPAIWSIFELSEEIQPKITRKRDFTESGITTPKYDEILVKNSDEVFEDKNGLPLIYDEERDATHPSADLTLENLIVKDLHVTHDADVDNDLRVGGDLYVNGTTHTVDEETIVTPSNTIVLRQNAENGLNNGEVSGIVVHNYNGTDDLSLVTDKDGTLRVGTGEGTTTDYTNIAYNNDTKKWYTPDEDGMYTIEVSPEGSLTSYADKKEEQPFTIYTDAVFTVIDETTLQPLLTRDEAEDLNDQGLLKWNADSYKANTIPLPTINGQTLTANINKETNEITYEWSGTAKASIFRFESVEEYELALEIAEGEEGYIPDGSIIMIDGEYNHSLGETSD